MAAALQSATLPPLVLPHSAADLAVEIAEALHLMAECWARGLSVPDPLLNRVDYLLRRVQLAQMLQEKIA